MKKLISIIAILVLAITLSGCSEAFPQDTYYTQDEVDNLLLDVDYVTQRELDAAILQVHILTLALVDDDFYTKEEMIAIIAELELRLDELEVE
jgi:PBP1b-binding outer membrane lipoprotein LpoB